MTTTSRSKKTTTVYLPNGQVVWTLASIGAVLGAIRAIADGEGLGGILLAATVGGTGLGLVGAAISLTPKEVDLPC